MNSPRTASHEMYVIPSRVGLRVGLPSCPWWEGGAYQVTPFVSQYPGGTGFRLHFRGTDAAGLQPASAVR